jgi:uncharacterized protein
MKRLLSVPEVAARFEVTNQTVRNWIASGHLAAVQPTRRGRFRIPSDALSAFEQEAGVREPLSETQPERLNALNPRTPMPEQPVTTRPKNLEAELDRVVRAIVASVHPEAVILFGSRARGDFRPDSDFDLAIVAPDGTGRRRLAMRAYEGVAFVRDRSVGVDIVVLTPGIIAAERDLAGSITRAVVRDGVSVYGSRTFA